MVAATKMLAAAAAAAVTADALGFWATPLTPSRALMNAAAATARPLAGHAAKPNPCPFAPLSRRSCFCAAMRSTRSTQSLHNGKQGQQVSLFSNGTKPHVHNSSMSHAMPRHAACTAHEPCHAMLQQTVLCHSMPRGIQRAPKSHACHAVLQQAMPCHVAASHPLPCHAMLHHGDDVPATANGMPCHAMSQHPAVRRTRIDQVAPPKCTVTSPAVLGPPI